MLIDSVRMFIEDVLTNEPSYFVVDIKYSGNNARYKKLSVIIDGDDGIDIDKCASISRKLANWLEEEDKINTAYQLEVTSPGIDFPLTQVRQYNKNIGKKIQVNTLDGNVIMGILKEVTNDDISIEILKKKNKKHKKQPKLESATGIDTVKNDIKKDISLKLIKSSKVLLDF